MESQEQIKRSLRLSRRGFLALLSAGGTAAALSACTKDSSPRSPQAEAKPTKPAELIYASATALARAIRAKQISSEEVVNAYLQRIEAVNPKLNAVVQLTSETAHAQAREADAALARGEVKGPLHGVPFTVKDHIDTVGVICTSGTKGRASFVPTQDATIVARLRAAGAILLGKTNMPELGLAVETDNLVYGRTNNPYDVARTPGGSSGGEGAIIAAGGSPLGLGTDAGASIRLPAHFCGIVGLKPTSRRVSKTGVFPGPGGVLDALWTPGPMARFVEDLSLTLPIMAGMDWHDSSVVPMSLGNPDVVNLKDLRIAFYTDDGMASPAPEVVQVVKRTANVLSNAGLAVEEARPQGIGQTFDIASGIFGSDGGTGLRAFLQMIGTQEIHPLLQQYLDLIRSYAISTIEFWGLLLRLDVFRSTMLSFMEKYDAILCPVAAYAAVPHGMLAWNVISYKGQNPVVTYTMTYSLTGWPAVVVRGGTSPEGLPIGVQVVARPWREDIALAVAQRIETALGGWQRPSL